MRTTATLKASSRLHAELLLGEDPRNSLFEGSGASSATTVRAPTRLWPARSAEVSTSRLSGSCSAKARRLRVIRLRIQARTMNGTARPIRAPNDPEDEAEDRHRENRRHRRSGSRPGSARLRRRRDRARARAARSSPRVASPRRGSRNAEMPMLVRSFGCFERSSTVALRHRRSRSPGRRADRCGCWPRG